MKRLIESDPEIAKLIDLESERQKTGLEMIASENYASAEVMEAQGSLLTNKYAEGYPGKRYYGGCEFVDKIETLAIERAKKLFKSKFANVQPHSGSQANMAAFLALANVGDKILGMDLSHGGHLTHGSPVNFSGIMFKASSYKIDPVSHRLNFEEIKRIALEVRPQILIAGYSAYPRVLDFSQFQEIAKLVDARLVVDMAHFSGLVAAEVHENPIEYADAVTSTTHKTLRGPRGGIILTQQEELAKKLNSKIFPGVQGGPLEHVIAAKAVAFAEALKPDFKHYIKQVVLNAQSLAEKMLSLDFDLVTGGTDNHLILVDLTRKGISGKVAESALDHAGITVNKNTVPNETKSPFVTSGIRIGTPALTTRGMKQKEMHQIALWIDQVLKDPENLNVIQKVRSEVSELCKQFPIYE
jgi:glycine hydroxymethyltransferase